MNREELEKKMEEFFFSDLITTQYIFEKEYLFEKYKDFLDFCFPEKTKVYMCYKKCSCCEWAYSGSVTNDSEALDWYLEDPENRKILMEEK